eukprot:Colp12_sorted_trinity150504_noHs@23953
MIARATFESTSNHDEMADGSPNPFQPANETSVDHFPQFAHVFSTPRKPQKDSSTFEWSFEQQAVLFPADISEIGKDGHESSNHSSLQILDDAGPSTHTHDDTQKSFLDDKMYNDAMGHNAREIDASKGEQSASRAPPKFSSDPRRNLHTSLDSITITEDSDVSSDLWSASDKLADLYSSSLLDASLELNTTLSDLSESFVSEVPAKKTEAPSEHTRLTAALRQLSHFEKRLLEKEVFLYMCRNRRSQELGPFPSEYAPRGPPHTARTSKIGPFLDITSKNGFRPDPYQDKSTIYGPVKDTSACHSATSNTMPAVVLSRMIKGRNPEAYSHRNLEKGNLHLSELRLSTNKDIDRHLSELRLNPNKDIDQLRRAAHARISELGNSHNMYVPTAVRKSALPQTSNQLPSSLSALKNANGHSQQRLELSSIGTDDSRKFVQDSSLHKLLELSSIGTDDSRRFVQDSSLRSNDMRAVRSAGGQDPRIGGSALDARLAHFQRRFAEWEKDFSGV